MKTEVKTLLETERIVLHIGYYKTATTFLQRQLFSKLSAICNVGKPNPDPRLGEMVVDILTCPTESFDTEKWRSVLSSAVAAERETSNEPAGIIVFSYESLCAPEGYSSAIDDHVPRRLKAVFGDAKILITIREQAGLVESLYLHNAKSSRYLPFEKWFRNNQADIHGLDFMAKVNLFETIFEQSNVYILPQEVLESNVELASEYLSNILGIPTREIEEALNTGPRENVRRTKRQFLFNRIRSSLLPNVSLGRFLPKHARRFLHRFLTNGTPATDVMPTSFKNDLRKTFSAGNRKLSIQYGLNLEKYGYFSADQDAL